MHTEKEKEKVIFHTRKWLTSFIIHFNICPFAKREYDRGSIHYASFESEKIEQCLNAVFTECQRLDINPDIETTLLIFPSQFAQFSEYLDFLTFAESLLFEQGYEGIYQLASFHPDYCFEGENTKDPANYTNRSPYPMLHFIREDSLERAISSYSNPEKIPERNIKLTRKMGVEKLKTILCAATKKNLP